jgi:transcriptional regulator with XRE-family HTH domain
LRLGDLAELSGIDKASLSRLENGFYPDPTVNTLARYASAIGNVDSATVVNTGEATRTPDLRIMRPPL